MKKLQINIAGLLVLLCLEPFLAGQSAGQDPVRLKSPQHDVKVTLKLIQVYVTDKKGSPVKNLTKEDFVLEDDGQIKKITDFEIHGAAGSEPSAAKAETGSGIPPASVMNRKFILLFNVQNTTVYGFNHAKNAALAFLDSQVKPGDEVGVFSYSDIGGLRVYEYLTQDRARIRNVVEKLKEILGPSFIGAMPIDGGAAAIEAARRERLAQHKWDEGDSRGNAVMGVPSIYSSAPSGNIPFLSLMTPAGTEAESVAAKSADFPLTMREIALALNYIPGYKNIILFSDGYPQKMVVGDTKFSSSYQKMAQDLAAASSPVFTVNTQGDRAHALPLSARGDFGLQQLSSATGGKFLGNVTDYKAIAQGIQDFTANYYVLGYYIGESWDGKFHEIKVSVDGTDRQVVTQSGYFNPKPFAEYSPLEKELQLIDLALSDRSFFQVPVKFSMAALPCATGPKPTVLLFSRIPLAEVNEIVRDKTEALVFVLDDRKRVVQAQRAELDPAKLPVDPAFPYSLISVDPGKYECRLVLRNLVTGKGAVAKATIDVEAPSNAEMRLMPPLLFLPLAAGKASYLNFSPAPSAKTAEAKPLTLQSFYPLTTNKVLPVIDGLPHGASTMIIELRAEIAKMADPRLNISVDLIDGAGLSTALPFRMMDKKGSGEANVCLLETDLPVLKAGRYSLVIKVADSSGNVLARTLREFEAV